MLISKIILIKVNRHNKHALSSKGYNNICSGDIIEVNINDIPYSRNLLICRCDICGRPFERTIENYTMSKSRILDIDACPECHQKKVKMATFEKYGVDNIFRLSEYILECNKAKHGGIHHTQTEEFKKEYLIKDKNHNWIGGNSKNPSKRNGTNDKWYKKDLLKRDGFACRACGSHKNLHVHHILPFAKYPEQRYKLDNGLILCQDCHNEFHSIYGKIHIGEVEIKEFIYNKSVTTN